MLKNISNNLKVHVVSLMQNHFILMEHDLLLLLLLLFLFKETSFLKSVFCEFR
jgi:hypothetical protein